jgi:UDP-N-acetylglucosamine 2-epimerase (non-hydrolysing)
MRIVSVVGSPLDLPKLAALHRALEERAGVEHGIVQTGRPDNGMSATACQELEVPGADRRLDIGAGPHGVETGLIMQRLEPLLAELEPDAVLAYGATNAGLAAALVAAKLGTQLGHVEAGLRCGDRTADEINRVVIDRLADLLFAPSRDAITNLAAEGVAEDRMHLVGSVLIDTLRRLLPKAEALDPAGCRGLAPGSYAVAALRQPEPLQAALVELEELVPVVDVRPGESPGYLEMVGLVAAAGLVVTDSEWPQEASSYLGIPCVTVGPGTDRLATCLHGTNRLVRAERAPILAAASRALARRAPVRPVLERWDGRAAERIVQVLCDGVAFPADAAAPAAAATPHTDRRTAAHREPALVG